MKILSLVVLLFAILASPLQLFSAKKKGHGQSKNRETAKQADQQWQQVVRNDAERQEKIVVLGGGIGGLTSALYLARAGIEPLVIEGQNPGGLITQSHSVQNWPGETEITGAELVEKVRKQAEANGVRFLQEEVSAVDFSKQPFTITLKKGGQETRTLQAESVIVAMGTQPNHLGIPGETGQGGYWGKGVSNCAICDGSLYRGMTVGVVGGGDASILEATYLSHIAKQVHVFVRKDSFKVNEEKRLRALLAKPNVRVFYNTTVDEIQGDGTKVTHVVLKSQGKKSVLYLDGLFLAIGSKPNSKIFQGFLELDEKGYIVLKKDQETSVPGVYAIGDIVDPVYKQAISASGDGAKAALQAEKYLSLVSTGAKSPISTNSTSLATSAQHEVIEITSFEQFEKEIQSSNVPIFVDFYASWCSPCKQIYPSIETSAAALAGKVKFLKVNVDRVDKIPLMYHIRSMPTALLLNSEGKVVDRKVGSNQVLDLLKTLRTPNSTN